MLEPGYNEIHATSHVPQFEPLCYYSITVRILKCFIPYIIMSQDKVTCIFLIICNCSFCDNTLLLFEIQSLFIVSLLEP
jgi:hypothetical protein